MIVLLRKAFALPPVIPDARVIDLLWHLPTGVIDRRAEPTVEGAQTGTIATLQVRVMKHRPGARTSNGPYKVIFPLIPAAAAP